MAVSEFDLLKIFSQEMEKLQNSEKYHYVITDDVLKKIKMAFEIAISSDAVSDEMIYAMVVGK